jgi:RNA polymerase sigma factor (sigma-70 family)
MITMNYNHSTFQTPVSHNSLQQRSGNRGKVALDLLDQPLEKQMAWVGKIVNKFNLPEQDYFVCKKDMGQEALLIYHEIVYNEGDKKTYLDPNYAHRKIVAHLNQYLRDKADQHDVTADTRLRTHRMRDYIPPSSVAPRIMQETVLSQDPQPMEALLLEDLQATLAPMLSELTPDEFKVLTNRLGLNGCSKLSLSKVAKKMNKSLERVRVTEAKAFQKLCSISCRDLLKGYLEPE